MKRYMVVWNGLRYFFETLEEMQEFKQSCRER